MKELKLLEVSKSYYPKIGGLELSIFNRSLIYNDLGIDYRILTTMGMRERVIDNSMTDNRKVIRLKRYTDYFFAPGCVNFDFSDYDIISINQIGKFICDYSLYKNKGKRGMILTPHFHFHTKRALVYKWLYDKLMTGRLLNMPDVIICFTNTEKNFWIDRFSIEPARIAVIPHFVNIPDLKEDYSSSAGSDYLFYLGRHDLNKRVDILLDVYGVTKRNTDLYLTLNETEVGGNLPEKGSDRLRFLGEISDERKYNLLRNCRGVVFPSDYEAFGLVLLEASAFRKPILCSDIPVFREILDERGVIFFENNHESLAAALDKFEGLSSADLLKMGEYNFENLSKYDYERIKGLYRELIDDLTGRKSD